MSTLILPQSANLVVSNNAKIIEQNNALSLESALYDFNLTSAELEQVLKVEKKLFDVSLQPLQVAQPLTSENPYVLSELYGTFNEQTKQHLGGVFGSNYHVEQPRQILMRLLHGLKSNNIAFENLDIVQMQDGAVLNIKAELPQYTQYFKNKQNKDDATNVSICFESSFNGSKSFSMMLETFRFLCSNGMRITDTHLKKSLKHTKGNKGKMLNNGDMLLNQLQYIEQLKYLYKVFLLQDMNEQMKKDFAYFVLGIDTKKDVSTRAKNMLEQLYQAIEIEVQDAGANVFALFNGATRYTNHFVGESSKTNEYLLLGTGNKINNLALSKAIELSL